MLRIADMLHKNGHLKVNTVNALAKSACFTQINLYLGYEAKEKAFIEWQKQEKLREKELKAKNYRHMIYPQDIIIRCKRDGKKGTADKQ
jgi:hypothetical protein